MSSTQINSILVYSFYKNEDIDHIEFRRIINNSGNYKYISGAVLYKDNIEQTIKEKRNISFGEIDNIKNELIQQGFRTSFDSYEKVMWIQLNLENIDEYQIYDKSAVLENKIKKQIIEKGFGKWIDKTIGESVYGSIDLILAVTPWNKVYKMMTAIIKKEQLENKTLIVRRLTENDESWSYEIVYPADYQGVFNP